MKHLVKALALSSLSMALTPLLHATDPTIAYFSCQTANGASFSVPLFYFDVGVDYQLASINEENTGSIAAGINQFPTFLAAVTAQTAYSACTIANGPASLTLNNVVMLSASAGGEGSLSSTDPGETYSEAIFNYASITVGGVTYSTKSQAAKPLSAEQSAIIKSTIAAAMRARASQ